MDAIDRKIIDSWLRKYVAGTIDSTGDTKAITRDCHSAHYGEIGMDILLAPFIGNLEAFIKFLTDTWKWDIDYDRENGTIIADENKDSCVCPLYKEGLVSSGRLCNCSEGFAERMFGVVTGRSVEARVIRSFIRDGKSCIYRIDLKG